MELKLKDFLDVRLKIKHYFQANHFYLQQFVRKRILCNEGLIDSMKNCSAILCAKPNQVFFTLSLNIFAIFGISKKKQFFLWKKIFLQHFSFISFDFRDEPLLAKRLSGLEIDNNKK